MELMSTIDQIIRKAAEPWMIENAISHSHAEDLYERIQEALRTERRERESTDGFHIGDRVRIVRRIHAGSGGGSGAGSEEVADEYRNRVGVLGAPTWREEQFDVVFPDGTRTGVYTPELEHVDNQDLEG